MAKAYYYLQDDGLLNGKEIELFGEIVECDNGIGSYEYWGFKGYDSQPYLDIEDIEWNHTLHSADENTLIDNYMNEHFDEIKETMLQEYTPDDIGGDPDDWRDEQYERGLDR